MPESRSIVKSDIPAPDGDNAGLELWVNHEACKPIKNRHEKLMIWLPFYPPCTYSCRGLSDNRFVTQIKTQTQK